MDSETEMVVKMSHNAGDFSIWGLVNSCVFSGGGGCFSIFLWSVNQTDQDLKLNHCMGGVLYLELPGG